MPRRMDDPPDGLRSTCVMKCVVHHASGRIFNLSLGADDLLVVAEHNDRRSRRVDQKCEKCDRPGVRFYDRHWCCDSCGQAILDKISEEMDQPVPKRPPKNILPGGRRRKAS